MKQLQSENLHFFPSESWSYFYCINRYFFLCELVICKLLTQLYIILTEFIDTIETSVKHLGCPLEGREGDIELVVSTEHHQVPHLATVGA